MLKYNTHIYGEMHMSKEQNIVNYYVICDSLKDVIRTGWKDWHVKRERLESVAEHTFSVQMLAIAMCEVVR